MRHYVISLISGYLGDPAIPVYFACSLCISFGALTVPVMSLPSYRFLLTRPSSVFETTDHRLASLVKVILLPFLCDEYFHLFAHHGIPPFLFIP